MKDSVVQGFGGAAHGIDRPDRNVSYSAWALFDDASAGPARRNEDFSRQWRSAWRTAKREGWSVAPPRSQRCDGTGAGGRVRDRGGNYAMASSASHPPPMARFLARGRRGLPAAHPPTLPAVSTWAPPEVVSQFVPREPRHKKTYTTAEVFRGLSYCSAPFTRASQIADDLAVIAEYPRFTDDKRALLRSVGILADQLAGMTADVFRLQSVCKVFGIVANLLEGKAMTPDDVLDVNMMIRSFTSIRQSHSSLYLQKTFVKGRASSPGGVPRVTVDQKKRVSGWPGRYLDTARVGAIGPRSPAITPDIEGRPFTSLELFYSEPGERPLSALTFETETINGDARQRGEVLLERAAGASDGVPYGTPDPDEAVMQRISAGMQPVAVEWAKVQSMPVRRRHGPRSRWERVPIKEYGLGHIDARGRDEGEVFIEGGKAYLRLDGLAVAVRKLFPEKWWVVDNHSYPVGDGQAADRLPPIPLRRVVGSVADRFIVDEPDWIAEPDASAVEAGEDGYIRYRGRKFIEMDGTRVEASLRSIQGEEAISDFAQRLMDALPAADAMQIIRRDDGSRWIEGAHGYYRLRFDLTLRDFYVVESGAVAEGIAPRRALVDFDIDRQRWIALLGQRRSGYEDILAARYLRVEALPEPLSVDESARLQAGEASSPERGPSPEKQDAEAEAEAEAVDEASAVQESDQSARSRPAPVLEDVSIDDLNADGEPDIDADDADDEVEEVDEVAYPEKAQGGASGRADFALTFPLYASSKTGLEREFDLFGHYAAHLKRFPFFSRANLAGGHRRRVLLRKGLRKVLAHLQATSMVAANRMEPAVRAELAPRVLSLRQRLVGLYPSEAEWYRLTLQQKQQKVSHMVELAYHASADEMWPCLSGYCNEIADVVMSALVRKAPKLRDHLMQVALYDRRGAKGTHVMLVYVDQPTHLDIFADRASQDVHVQRLRPTFDEADFYDWLLVNRDGVLLIDAWATNKLVDLSEASSHALVGHEMLPNLREAGFNLDGRPRFRVRAVLPRRPPNAVRPRREVDRVRVLNSAPATWEVLAAWAVTGVLPPGSSASALHADLSAAADSAKHDVARQSVLRALAAEIAPMQTSGTDPARVNRRIMVMAGHAAWALLDAASTTSDVAEPRTATLAAHATGAPTAAAVTTDAIALVGAARPGDGTPMNEADATTDASDPVDAHTTATDLRLASYSSTLALGERCSAVRQSGSQTYLWMPDGKYYAVREIMPGRLFIVDPDEGPFGRPSLPPIPLERDGALWRVVGRRL